MSVRRRRSVLAKVLLCALAAGAGLRNPPPPARAGQAESPPGGELGSDAGAAEAGGYVFQDEIEVQRALEEVLSDAEFTRLRRTRDEEETTTPGFFERALDWLAELFAGRDAKQREVSFGFPGMDVVLYSGAALLLAVALALILRALVRSPGERRLREPEEEARLFRASSSPGATSPEEYAERAQRLRRDGDYRGAVRELLLGAMSAVERRGALRYRAGLTSRDYLRAVRGERRASLRTIVRVFEEIYFGRRAATAASFEECAAAFRGAFLAAASPATEIP